MLEDPPDRLHEVSVHRLVIVVEIHPTGHAFHSFPPLASVAQHDGAALLVEVLHSEFLDLRTTLEFQRLLHLVLDGQAVRVPAKATLHPEAAHCLVAWDHVLDGACEQVSIVRQAGRKRRAIVKAERPLLRTLFDGFLEDALLPPKA